MKGKSKRRRNKEEEQYRKTKENMIKRGRKGKLKDTGSEGKEGKRVKKRWGIRGRRRK